ncbi:MAG: hypothetical protein ACI9K5_004036 [Gammaproteobacteria bacterium]|jgi:hypothetical protein
MFIVALFIGSLPSVGPVHPSSVSRTTCVIDGVGAQVDIRFQTLSLLEVLPELDRDQDGRFTQEDMDAARDQVGDYLLANWRLLPPPFSEDKALGGSLTGFGFAADLVDPSEAFQWIDARLEFSAEMELEEIRVHSELFTERDPYHRDYLVLTFPDGAEWPHVFSTENHEEDFRASHLRRADVRQEFFSAGLRGGPKRAPFSSSSNTPRGGQWRYGLALFLASLAVVSRSPRQFLRGIALLFLGLSLGLASLRFTGAPSERWVVLALPLALAYIGANNLLSRNTRTAWVEAPLFGLLLTYSVAVIEADALEFEPLKGQATLGLVGAILVLVAGAALFAYGLARFLPGRRVGGPDEAIGIAPAWLLLAVSPLAVVVGLGAFLTRTAWF